ncbi:MAG: carbamoyltransferase HypF [Acidobacteria bacterium]|nr:MAG: carbamoyltransferase HypF [Acidobacteriota bacterium]
MAHGGLHIEVRGTVQGVGYRPWVYQLAQRIGVAGRVWNDSRGVSIDAYGTREALDGFLAQLQAGSPPAASVRSVTCSELSDADLDAFTIAGSATSSERRVSIPADLATCDDCLRELLDPDDRRYRYPFINCTNCGPRYSIVYGSPYDRAKTSMARFTMCDACRREYESPSDRRFHAQPNACPDCGPRLVAMTPQGNHVETDDPIRFAARALRAGLIVAVKGLGGFHLACDATSPQAVQRLRERKHRETKPLAIMVPDLAEAETLAELNDEERALLVSIERPIVLAKASNSAPAPAPGAGGLSEATLIGLFLPYTPLHHLLLRDAGMPLVMTSGNFSDEPMVTTNDDALHQLGEVADLFLMHDRDIVTRVDDSVVRVIAGAPTLIRRARGYVPHAIETRREFAEPILACGAHLKNTFCIASGTAAFLGPHIGDLESVATLHAYESAIERMKEFIGVSPKLLVHDLHPDYFSTRYALAESGVRTIGVQHHHAHVASVMAEHGLDGPVIGIAYDGTGFGTDGTSWGGEILIARYAGFERFATFRAIPLAGGDLAIRQPWRIALALLDDAFDGEPPPFEIFARKDVETVRRMIARNFNSMPARGVGRYFDAFGALFLNMPDAHYEGEVAFQWNLIADPSCGADFPVRVSEAQAGKPVLHEIDLRPTMRAAVDAYLHGVSPATISARFHNTIAAVTAKLALEARAMHGELPVVLSGGCFQNARLAESVIDAIGGNVFMNRGVPPGDGGIALGQAFIAREIAACA